MELYFPHLTNAIRTSLQQRRLIIPRRLLKTTVTLVLCSVVLVLSACNVGGGGY